MRPLGIVDNLEFKVLLQKLDPRYVLPCRRHFADKIIPEMYSEKKREIGEKLQKAQSIALTTDYWTSRACQSYITVTVHFVADDWTIKNFLLSTKMLAVSHTGENLGNALIEVMGEWSLLRYKSDSSIVAITSDNASNMDIAAKVGGFEPHIKCFAHTLNLASQRALKTPAMAKLVSRIKRIVAFSHKSTTATAVLKAKQSLLNIPEHKLIIDVATRWNSSFEMITRFLEQQPAISSALTSNEVKRNVKDIVTLSDMDINDAEKAIDVLKPLKIATTIMCDQHFPTVSMIFPLRSQILDSMVEKAGDCKLIREVKEAIRSDLTPRYRDNTVENFLLMSTALDPRFRSLPHVDDSRRQEVYDLIESKALTFYEAIKVKVEKNDDVPPQAELPEMPQMLGTPALPQLPQLDDINDDKSDIPPAKRSKGAMEDLFGDVFIVNATPGRSTSDLVHDEVERYRSESNIALNADPLQWWKSHLDKFPKLSIVAQAFLGIPGTSVPSERVFSCAGDIVTATRSCLDPELVDKLIFLKINFRY